MTVKKSIPKILGQQGSAHIPPTRFRPHILPPFPESSAFDSPNSRVVLDSQVDVLSDTESEVSRLGEVLLPQLVLLDLESTLEDLLCLGATDGNVHRNLLVTSDSERPDRVAGLGRNGRLSRQLLEDLGRSREPVSGLSHRDICTHSSAVRPPRHPENPPRTDHELLDDQILHRVGWGGSLSHLRTRVSLSSVRLVRYSRRRRGVGARREERGLRGLVNQNRATKSTKCLTKRRGRNKTPFFSHEVSGTSEGQMYTVQYRVAVCASLTQKGTVNRETGDDLVSLFPVLAPPPSPHQRECCGSAVNIVRRPDMRDQVVGSFRLDKILHACPLSLVSVVHPLQLDSSAATASRQRNGQ